MYVCMYMLILLNLQLHTPLHEASAAGQTVVVTLLLDHGADRNARDKVGYKYMYVHVISGAYESPEGQQRSV